MSLSQLGVAEDRAPELAATFRKRARLMDADDGCIDIQVRQSDRDRAQLFMVSRWRDRALCTAYTHSPGTARRTSASIPGTLVNPPDRTPAERLGRVLGPGTGEP